MLIAWREYPLEEDVTDFQLPVLRNGYPYSDVLVWGGDHTVTLEVAACDHPGSTLRWGLFPQLARLHVINAIGCKFE